MVDRRSGRTRIRELLSPSSSLLKVFRRALAEGTTREGWLAVEGPLLIEEALKAFARAANVGRARVGHAYDGGPNDRTIIHCVLFSRSAEQKFARLLQRLPQEAEVARVSDRLFQQVAQTPSPQGIAALVELKTHDLATVLGRRDVLLLVACGLQDPGNLGTMMRSAQALGGTALITLEATVSPFNPKAVRSSAGAIFRLPVLRNMEADALLAQLRARGVCIVAADRRSPSPLTRADLRGSVAFLIGKEATGLDEDIAREAGLRLSIPIRPGTDSVNAATAAGIFLYEAARQRGFLY